MHTKRGKGFSREEGKPRRVAGRERGQRLSFKGQGVEARGLTKEDTDVQKRTKCQPRISTNGHESRRKKEPTTDYTDGADVRNDETRMWNDEGIATNRRFQALNSQPSTISCFRTTDDTDENNDEIRMTKLEGTTNPKDYRNSRIFAVFAIFC